MFFAAGGLRLGILATLIVLGLVAKGRHRSASLWQRTAALVAGSLVLAADVGAFPILLGAGWMVTTSSIAFGGASGAVALQVTRAIRLRPAAQLALGVVATILGLMSGVEFICLYVPPTGV